MNQTTTFPKVFTNLCKNLFTLYEKKIKSENKLGMHTRTFIGTELPLFRTAEFITNIAYPCNLYCFSQVIRDDDSIYTTKFIYIIHQKSLEKTKIVATFEKLVLTTHNSAAIPIFCCKVAITENIKYLLVFLHM